MGSRACLAIFQQLLLAVHKDNLILFGSIVLQFFIDVLDALGVLVRLWIYVAAFAVTSGQDPNQNDCGTWILLLQQVDNVANSAGILVALNLAWSCSVSHFVEVGIDVQLHPAQSAEQHKIHAFPTCMRNAQCEGIIPGDNSAYSCFDARLSYTTAGSSQIICSDQHN